MSTKLCSLVFLILTSVAYSADPPTVTLDAKPQYNRDSKIVFKVNGLDGTKARLKWWVRSTDSPVKPETEEVGNVCFVWAGPGHYEVLITVGVVDSENVNWIDLEHQFTVGDVPPQPKPPEPQPQPKPSDFSGAKDKVKEFAATIRDDKKEEAAKIIAAAYKKHGELAAKGEYKTPELLAEATSSEFVYELGLSRYLRWRPMMSHLREHMAALMAEDKLKTMQDWARLWAEYAKGFEEVK